MQAILALNTGSSSIKFALYAKSHKTQPPQVLCHGSLTGIPHVLTFSVVDANHQSLHQPFAKQTLEIQSTFENAFDYLLDWIKNTFPYIQLKAAGHRIVHGGTRFKNSVRIDEEVMTYLKSLIPLAPLHQSHNLESIEILRLLNPHLVQIACFDTSFHNTQPTQATTFALPKELRNQGIRRYGFHGLSYRYIAEVLPDFAGKKAKSRVVVAHLGQGASMCALHNLKSIATTMGFTALDGLPMGTRCGAIDPGVILYLIQEKGCTASYITDLLYNKSGLLGLSEVSNDMRVLLDNNTTTAKEAVEFFCYRIQRELGSLVAALKGLDILVFTGGIGENAQVIRQKVCKELNWLNLVIDDSINDTRFDGGQKKISTPESAVDVWVIPTDEELMIAKDTFDFLD